MKPTTPGVPDSSGALVRELLAETDDVALQRIVERAAQELGTPMALVTLLFDEVQFFKAHHGLPDDLQAARVTARDLSFCQFVVQEGAPFEVSDAASDVRVPRDLVEEYDLRAYLGHPIYVDGHVVGSLCVLDTTPRDFSDGDRTALSELAGEVNQRLAGLVERRRSARLALVDEVGGTVLRDLAQALDPVRNATQASLEALAQVRSFLRLYRAEREGVPTPPSALVKSHSSAEAAAERVEDLLFDIDMFAADSEDYARALTRMSVPDRETKLIDVLEAVQDLARSATERVGGAPLPELDPDLRVSCPRPLAIAVLTAAWLTTARALERRGKRSGIEASVSVGDRRAHVWLRAPGLPKADRETVAAQAHAALEGDPSLSAAADGDAVRFDFVPVRAN